MANKDPLVCTGLFIYCVVTHYFHSKFGIIVGICQFFGQKFTQDYFSIHPTEVNIEQLLSVPIKHPAFKNGGFLHAVAQVFTWFPFDNKLNAPHPEHRGILCLFNNPDYYYLRYIYFQLNVIDCQFTNIHLRLMAVSSILQTQTFLLSRGVSILPSAIVHTVHLLKVSNILPKDSFDMTALYKSIIGLGGGIRHIFEFIFEVKSSMTSSMSRFEVIFEFKCVTSSTTSSMSRDHIVLFVVFGNKGFTTTVDERKAEVAISREENKRTDLGHLSSPLSINGDLIPQQETILNGFYGQMMQEAEIKLKFFCFCV